MTASDIFIYFKFLSIKYFKKTSKKGIDNTFIKVYNIDKLRDTNKKMKEVTKWNSKLEKPAKSRKYVM